MDVPTKEEGEEDEAMVAPNKNDAEEHATVYTDSADVRIVVHDDEEWLCVARLPVDFSQDELEALALEFGAFHQAIRIKSTETGG